MLIKLFVDKKGCFIDNVSTGVVIDKEHMKGISDGFQAWMEELETEKSSNGGFDALFYGFNEVR